MTEAETTSWNLIAQAAAGHAPARAEFARLYGPAIRTLIEQRWHSGPLRQHLEDAAQEVFVECLKPGGVLQQADPSVPEGFRSLLGAVARNVALRFEERAARQRQRVASDAAALDEQPASQTSLAQALDRQWARALLLAAVDEQELMATRSGAAALLRLKILQERFRAGRSIVEIAQQWGEDPAYLHHQYAKARRDFLRALLKVLARRFPQASRAELRTHCRKLIELSGG